MFPDFKGARGQAGKKLKSSIIYEREQHTTLNIIVLCRIVS
jgi:hypothetical protein